MNDIICPNCGTPNSPSANFCESCGGSLESAKAAVAAAQASKDYAEPQPAPAPAPEPSYQSTYQEPAYQQPTYTYDDNTDTFANDTADKQATASVILGIVGLCLCCCMPCGIAGLICGILAKKGGAQGKATAGIVMAIIIIVLNVLSGVYYAVATAMGASNELIDAINSYY